MQVSVPVNWRQGVPVLDASDVFLREVLPEDAPAVASVFECAEVSQYLPPGPSTEPGFGEFIAWTIRARQLGQNITFAVVPKQLGTTVGFFQIWPLQPDFAVAEWGFALGRQFWGTGLFVECARLVVEFAFDSLGVRRLEARAAVEDHRGNGALRKIGATREMVLRKCFPCWDGVYRDHVMWAIMSDAAPAALEREDSGTWALTPVRNHGNHQSLDAASQLPLFGHPLSSNPPPESESFPSSGTSC